MERREGEREGKGGGGGGGGAHWDSCQLWLIQQTVEFVLGGIELLMVSSIHHVPIVRTDVAFSGSNK